MTEVRNLKILSCEVGFQGTGAKGPYTIYNIKADGVAAKLNAFSELPLGEGAFTVTPYKPGDGQVIYTLAPVEGAGSKTAELRADVDALTEIVKDLTARVEALESPPTAVAAAAEEDIPFLWEGPPNWDRRYEHGSRW